MVDVQLLGACTPISHASQDTLLSLYDHAYLRRYPSNAAVYWQGDSANSVYVLVSGKVRLTAMSSQGRIHETTCVPLFQVFGETACLAERCHETTAWTVGEVQAWEIQRDAFRRALISDPGLCLGVVELLANRSVDESILGRTKSEPLHWRVARLLLSQDQDLGWVHITHTELATSLGVTREATTRALSRLKGLKLVATQRRGIQLINPQGLERLLSRD